MLVLALVLVSLAARATIVTTNLDEDNGSLGGGSGISLREAVRYSPSSSTITFSSALSGKIIRLTLGQIIIGKSLTINASALAARLTLSGDKTGNGRTNGDTGVIYISSGTIVLDSLAISGGFASNGGGIYIGSGTTVTVRNSAISGNYGTDGGGIYSYGSLLIENSTLVGNSSDYHGGCIFNRGSLTLRNSKLEGSSLTSPTGVGGGIYNDGSTSIYDSTFSGNTAQSSGGCIYNVGPLTVYNSSFSGNSAVYGGAFYNYSSTVDIYSSTFLNNYAPFGGALYITDGTVNLNNSTFAKNSADFGGAINVVYGIANLNNCTLSGNSAASYGGGIFSNSISSVTLQSSIVAGNFAPQDPNLVGRVASTNSLTSGSPRLAPLGDYGGLTYTMPPLPGSPAIGTGGTPVLTTDQRGMLRDVFPDMGAAEYQGTFDLERFWKLDPDGDGSLFGVELALGTDNFISDPSNARNLTIPTINSSGQVSLAFGINDSAPAGTQWILSCSPDLSPGNFVEIYRFDGITDIHAPLVSFHRSPNSIEVIDGNPHSARAFYRFEAVLGH